MNTRAATAATVTAALLLPLGAWTGHPALAWALTLIAGLILAVLWVAVDRDRDRAASRRGGQLPEKYRDNHTDEGV